MVHQPALVLEGTDEETSTRAVQTLAVVVATQQALAEDPVAAAAA